MRSPSPRVYKPNLRFVRAVRGGAKAPVTCGNVRDSSANSSGEDRVGRSIPPHFHPRPCRRARANAGKEWEPMSRRTVRRARLPGPLTTNAVSRRLLTVRPSPEVRPSTPKTRPSLRCRPPPVPHFRPAASRQRRPTREGNRSCVSPLGCTTRLDRERLMPMSGGSAHLLGDERRGPSEPRGKGATRSGRSQAGGPRLPGLVGAVHDEGPWRRVVGRRVAEPGGAHAGAGPSCAARRRRP